MASVITAPRL